MRSHRDVTSELTASAADPSAVAALASHWLQSVGRPEEKFFAGQLREATGLIKLPKALEFDWDVPFPPPSDVKFTFIDLFAGIGGMRLAFQSLGGKCVFTSEWDGPAQKTYEANFGEVPFGDITTIDAASIPNHDVLVAGFPCQAFSIAGRKAGFEDTRGTLFFDVARIVDAKRPKAFFLENVKGLVSHDRGRTLAVILRTLREDLGYYVPEPQIMNARHFGVAQNRERIFIVGFKDEAAAKQFRYPDRGRSDAQVRDVLEAKAVSAKYYLSDRYLDTLVAHKARHDAKGNGFGYNILKPTDVTNALVVGGMGRERNLIIDKRQKNLTPVTNIAGSVNTQGIRRLTPREWARLQGFPDEFLIPVSDAQAYKQFGNSVAVPAIRATAVELLRGLGHDAARK